MHGIFIFWFYGIWMGFEGSIWNFKFQIQKALQDLENLDKIF